MAFILSLNNEYLPVYLAKQLNNVFPDQNPVNPSDLKKYSDIALERLKFCFSFIKSKYYYDQKDTFFNHLHADHYASFLYLISNTVYQKNGPEDLASKLFLLNKQLNGIDAFYSIKLPEIFLFTHPIGTVLGNADYKNYLLVYQNCTVGSHTNGSYPIFGEGVTLFAKSSVIGNCRIGNNVTIGANSFILNTDIPDDTTVTGGFPNHKISKGNTDVFDYCFSKNALQ